MRPCWESNKAECVVIGLVEGVQALTLQPLQWLREKEGDWKTVSEPLLAVTFSTGPLYRSLNVGNCWWGNVWFGVSWIWRLGCIVVKHSLHIRGPQVPNARSNDVSKTKAPDSVTTFGHWDFIQCSNLRN